MDWNARLQKEKLIARVSALNKRLNPDGNFKDNLQSEPTDMNENKTETGNG